MPSVLTRFGVTQRFPRLFGAGKVRILTHPRSLHYLGVLLALLLLSIVVPYTGLSSTAALATTAGTLAANLALLAGLAALLYYTGTRNPVALFAGWGFLGAALLDGYQLAAVVAAAGEPRAAAAGSQWFLPLWLWFGVWASGSAQRLPALMRAAPGAIGLAGAGLALAVLVLLRALPASGNGIAGQVAAAVLFFGAVEALLRRRQWPQDIFEHCLMLSLTSGFVVEVLFRGGSQQPYDATFTAALHLKNLSYLVALAGPVVAMRQLFRQAERNTQSLAEVNAALQREVDEHLRVRQQYQQLAVSLEQRVEERTRESAEARQAAERAKEDADRARRIEQETNRELRAQIAERLEAEQALRESESRLQLALSAGHVGIWTWDVAAGAAQWDEQVYEIFGQRPASFTPTYGDTLRLIHPEDAEHVRRAIEGAQEQGGGFDIAYRILQPGGRIRHVLSRAKALRGAAGTATRMIGTLVDVTEHKRGEDELRRRGDEVSQVVTLLGCLYEIARLLEQSEMPLEKIYERTIELLPLSWHDPGNTFARLEAGGRQYRSPGWRDTALQYCSEIVAADETIGRLVIGYADSDPEQERMRQEEVKVTRMVAASLERTIAYKRAAEELRRSERRYHGLFTHMISGCSLHEIVVDETGKPADYRFLEINPAFERMWGLKAEAILGKTAREVLPGIEQHWIRTYGQVALGGEAIRAEQHVPQRGRYFEVAVFSPEKGRFATIFHDVTERKRAEAQQAAEHNLLRTLIDNIPASIYVKDKERCYLINNQANVKRLGLAEEHQARGKRVFDFFPREHAKLYDADDRAVLESGVPVIDREEPYHAPNGDLGWYSTTKVPLLGAKGEVIGLVGISRDITAHKHAEETVRESRRRMETLLGNLPGMAYRCKNDPDWTMEFVSKGCEALTGLKPAELLKLGLGELIHPEDRAAVWNQVQRAIQERRPFQMEYRIHAADGRSKWLWEQGTAIFSENGGVEALEGFIIDISKRRQAEEELERKAKELAASNAELEQYAYAASHDLQEPLRMIAGYTQLLGRRYRGKLDGDADEFIRFIIEGAERMQTLIRDLLAYSRVGRDGQRAEPVDADDCARASLENLKAVLEESAAAVELGPLPEVAGQRSQLIQLFQNLIGNALKYRGADTPRVRVSAERHGNEWLFAVRDNGIGIDPQYHGQVFELFRRLHGRNEYSGTGIGLAICKKIVENHGGRIWVESEAGHGATFYFTMPAQAGPTTSQSGPHASRQEETGHHVA